MVPLLFLMAAGPIARWKHADIRAIARHLALAFAIAALGGVALPFALGEWSPLVAMGLMLALWITAGCVTQIRDRMKTGTPPRAYWGMQLAHLGVAVFVVGVTLVGGYQVEKDVRMEPGDTVSIDRYTFRFLGVREVPGPNYRAMRGDVELIVGGKVEKMLNPEKRNYFTSQMPMTEAAIDAGLTRDVYVSLGEPLEGKAWAVRVYFKPFVDWIWGGCLLMALGGLVAASDRRYRLRAKAERLAAAGAAA
jgi:cytochrome c-type biogenesis protein CcmF